MTETLQEKQRPIDIEIVNELIVIIPETWDSVILEVEYSSEGNNEMYRHIISSPGKHRESAQPSEALFLSTRKLSLVFKEYGHQWKKVTYTVSLEDDGSWIYKANFEY
jgi:hypothetical protein